MSNRILIVDDDRTMVGTLCDIFELRGWEVNGAYSGDEAVTKAMEGRYSLVLMDVKMEGMNGVEALKEIKKNLPDARVVLMTAYSAESLLDEARRAGAFRILAKPVDVGALLELLEHSRRNRSPVVIVDHDEVFLSTISDVLRLKGFDATTAHSVAEAKAVLENAVAPAVLLHISMDSSIANCVQAVREVRPDAAVFMYSGRPDVIAAAREDMPPGLVQGFIEKPISIDKLTELLNDIQ